MIYRVIAKGLLKVKSLYLSKVMPVYNRIMLRGMGVKFLGRCSIMGHCLFSAGRNSSIIIGRDLRIVGTDLFNPLCKNRARICVSENARLEIGDYVGMSSPTIWVRKSIRIGNHVNLGGGVILMDTDAHSLNYVDRRDGDVDMANRLDRPIVIEDDVLVGAFAIILKGVTIGARSVIGAGSVVTKDIPADCVAAGNPAKVIKQLRQDI